MIYHNRLLPRFVITITLRLRLIFLLSGFIAMAAFFVHQMQRKKAGTSGIVVEILLGLVASVLLGVGSFFGMMVFDLYI